MKWLRRKLLNWLNDRGDIYPVEASVSPVARVGVDMEGLAFAVMPAQGGTIVQIRHQYEENSLKRLVMFNFMFKNEPAVLYLKDLFRDRYPGFLKEHF